MAPKKPLPTRPKADLSSELHKDFMAGLDIEFQRYMMRQTGNIPPEEPSRLEPRLQRDFVFLSDLAERLAGCEPGFDRKLLKRLESGLEPPTATLDLHGYRADVFIHLFDWLREAARQDHRCVLVICGKGRGYGEKKDMGLIKSQLGEWMARHPYVMAYCTAQPKDGGGGAVYAYLRRERI